MLEAKPLSRALNLENWQERAALILVVLVQAVALTAFALLPVLAFNWLQTPSLGGFLSPDLHFYPLAPLESDHWPAHNLNLGLDDQLVALDGQELSRGDQLASSLQAYAPGDGVRLVVRTGTELREVPIVLSRLSGPDLFTFLYLPFMLGLVFLGSGLWVLGLRRRDTVGRAFAVFTAAAGLIFGASFDLLTTQRMVSLWTLALAFAGGALFHLAMVFPDEAQVLKRHRLLSWAGYPLALGLAAFSLAAQLNAPEPARVLSAWTYQAWLLVLIATGFVSRLALRRISSPSPIARAQARLGLWAALVALGPPVLGFVAWLARPGGYSAIPLVPLALFPLAVGYAILRFRSLDTDYVLSRATVYALLTVLTTAGYAFLVAGAGLLLNAPVSASDPFMVAVLVLFVALMLNPLRERLQLLVDGLFFRGRSAYQEKLAAFSHELTRAVELPHTLQTLRRTIQRTLVPSQIHIFVHDPLSNQYVTAPDERGRRSSDLRFPARSPLVQTLTRRGAAYSLDRLETIPRVLHDDWARMSLLGAQIYIPMPGQQTLTGWLALGGRRSGEPYTGQDLAFLEALGDQAALAIERAQVIADLERRVHQMNVLTRVAQGVNITSAFDDLLELLYAQTNQILATQDFFITLKDEKTGTLSQAFFLEKNERLREREEVPLGDRHGLAGLVIETGRAIVAEDYETECRNRAVLPEAEGIYAWVSVPLNTSDATIGALSLGSRDPSQVFTPDQREILQAIADQAAGAIAKARLLQETERRARQLATLNEVAQSLSSTLDLDPLLSRILQSAVDILDCEAGSLFMVDEQTDELVFAVTVGPVASELVGMRLAPGTGLVGKSADSGEPIIANNVQERADWFGDTDEQTGFVTRAMLVVPLQVKGKTLGVIEVINKRDRSPFTLDEQELLTVFTGQAAVAIENARLYTLTDQALAARVEELSVMQRIDRELNASLDMNRAMKITLDWAMRQSKADAGLVALLDEAALEVMAHQGLERFGKNGFDPEAILELPGVQRAIQSGSVQAFGPGESLTGSFLNAASAGQAAVPIRREADVIGMLLLESRDEPFSEEKLQFLNRLSDHAAIAISNAHFYAEVQAANLAKSDFVSFVSHELKTPMTSIKGYADLLATGAVGPVTEAQSNFLSTIRSNVNRMATLVSDLADISRIEAGRLRLEFGSVAIIEVVEEVVRSTRGQIEEKEQGLVVDVPEDLPPVWGDRTRLIQVLTNLVSNAHKYTPEGGEIQIRAEAGPNAWDPEGAPEVVHLAVVDNGIGISPEDEKKIFQKFFRSEDEKAREAPGTGLGLNITKNLVEMQGGRIWFNSIFREGTTFHFTIPVVESGA